MEDEEYYHMMQDDLERLERVHHHHSQYFNQRTSQPGDKPVHSALISGLRLAVLGAVKAGLDVVGTGRDGKRRKSIHAGAGH